MGSAAVDSQTQVPPLSATMLALTAIMYLPLRSAGALHETPPPESQTHAMAKKVARPARASVRKSDPFRDFGYGTAVSTRSTSPIGACLMVWLTCPDPSRRNQRPTALSATFTLMV